MAEAGGVGGSGFRGDILLRLATQLSVEVLQ